MSRALLVVGFLLVANHAQAAISPNFNDLDCSQIKREAGKSVSLSDSMFSIAEQIEDLLEKERFFSQGQNDLEAEGHYASLYIAFCKD